MDLNKLTKDELKGELAKRGEDVSGTKTVLKERLEQVIQEEGIDAKHIETMTGKMEGMQGEKRESAAGSVAGSVAGSSTRSSTSVKSERALQRAKLAGLIARREALKKRHEIEEQEEKLKKMKEVLEVEAEIEESEAKDKVLSQYTDATLGDEVKSKMMLKDDAGGKMKKEESPQRLKMSEEDGESEEAKKQQGDRRQEKLMSSNPEKRSQEVTLDLKMMKRINLPELKLRMFDGDIAGFKPFLQAFDTNIASKTDDEYEKLLYLLQLTKGKVHEIVSTCLHLPSDRCYKEAVKLLNRRFSNNTQTAMSLVDKLVNFHRIRADDVEELDTFSVQLCGAFNALQCIPGGTGVVGPKQLSQMVEKLPPGMVDRWRRVVDRNEQEERSADLKDLVDFVEQEARIARHPIFGRHATSQPKKEIRDGNRSHMRAMAGSLRAGDSDMEPRGSQIVGEHRSCDSPHIGTRVKCGFCGGHHATDVCRQLSLKTEQEKTDFVMQKGLCFSCLQFGHRSKDCQRRKTCQKCHKRHPTALHRDVTGSPTSSSDLVTTGHIASSRVAGGAKLQSVKVQVKFLGRMTTTRAFLDTGSTHSFISRRLVNKLGISPQSKTSVVLSTVNDERKLESSLVTQVQIENLDGEENMELPALYVLEKIHIAPDDLPSDEDVQLWDHLKENGVSVDEVGKEEEVGLLIGANAAAVMEPLQVVKSQEGGPYAIRTRYGWILGGVKKTSSKFHVNRISVQEETEDWFGNRADTRKGLSVEDVQWCTMMETGCVKKDEKYEVKLPFREKKPTLSNNREVAEKRLELLRKKFAKDPSYAAEYTTRMNDMLEKGHVEEAPEVRDHEGQWFLPHFGVRHPQKQKIRVVFDCAAQHHGRSLNDTLLQGPDLANPLIDVLVRFREEPYAFTGDLEAMFMQVLVPETQRDYLRFLWWPEGDFTRPPKEYRNTRHLFGAKSSPSCANFALHRTAEDGGDGMEEAKHAIRRNFYVDDVLKSVESEDAAIELLKDLRHLCATGGFHLTKINSNSDRVLQSVPREERAREVKNLSMDTDVLPTERALGVLWDTVSDSLGFQVDVEKLRKKPVTKRGMLSATASCYDPLGLVAPCIVRARGIIQELFRLKLSWDDKVPDATRKAWERWLRELQHLSDYRIPRCLAKGGIGPQVQLHHFADASQRAYGTASYVRTTDADGEIHCTLLMSKARLTPLKAVSIPRLELTAAKLAVELGLELSRMMDVEVVSFFWTDSTTVLKYIRNVTTRFDVFVSNRLAVIRDGSAVEQWRYVPTDSNPADLVSRGADALSLTRSDLWKHGPGFLRDAEEFWPQCPDDLVINRADPEPKAAESSSAMVVTIRTPETQDHPTETAHSPVQRLLQHFSTWRRLVRAVALLRRAFSLLRYKSRPKSATTKEDRPPTKGTNLSPSDLVEAERCIIRDVQRRHFGPELGALQAGRQVRASSRLSRLNPFWEEDLVKLGGRLENSGLSRAARHPIVLPNDDRAVDLMIEDTHRKVGHEGRQHVMADIGQFYWILSANSAVRRVLGRCVSCRRRQKPPESQLMADLPEDRVLDGDKPFACTGVDYFGPFHVKRGRTSVKKYGVIFTCLAVRAVHLEVADSLSTDSFLCALRRFISRRGDVRLLRSDQGTNFKGADRELQEEVAKLKDREEVIQRAALDQGIEWKFNPPHASHFGGVWERLIRTVRKILGALLTQQSFSDETLHTLLCEVECVMNNRPLIPVSMDPRDQLPISPNHLLHLRCVTLPAADKPDGHDLVGRKQLKQAAYLAEMFWRRWRQEYLPLLQQRTGPTTRSKTNVREGDVVLLVDGSVPRGVWPMGRVEEAYAGADGRVRTVRVRARGATYVRPVTKIVKIVEAE